jgi:hypothetical protein
MGYCFTIETANAVAHLSNGKVRACFNQLISDKEMLLDFKRSLEEFDDNIYTTNRRKQGYIPVVERLAKSIGQYYYSRDEKYADKTKAERYEAETLTNIYNGLKEISDLFSQNRYKALLLPQVVQDRKEQNINSEESLFKGCDLLRKLVEIHPEESCLILQPYAKVFSHSAGIALVDAFSHFDKALKQIHL